MNNNLNHDTPYKMRPFLLGLALGKGRRLLRNPDSEDVSDSFNLYNGWKKT